MPRTMSRPVSHRSIQRLVGECLDDVEVRLGFRPDVHLELHGGRGVSRTVAAAVRDALELSLARVANHRGSTSAFVSVAERHDTVEVCVVDDGEFDESPVTRAWLVQACGVEHDIDDFGAVGVCQWWSIPLDLGA